MAPRWFERASEEIEADYAAGQIDYGEFHNRMRELNQELRDAAHEAAEDTYERYFE